MLIQYGEEQEKHLIYATREEWGARYSPGGSPMAKHINTVVIHHTVIPPTGPEGYDADIDLTDDPCLDMRRTEDVLEDRNLDPGYSYTFHPSGVILEGAGDRRGAHTQHHNGTSYGFAAMGNYDKFDPTLSQLINMGRWINLMRLSGQLEPKLQDIHIIGHRDTKSTACPGANLYPALKWIRWFAHNGV